MELSINTINEEIFRIKSLISLSEGKILNEGVLDALITRFLSKQVIRNILTGVERDLLEKFMKESLQTISDVEKQELSKLIKSSKGETILKELKLEADASTNFIEKGTLNQKISDLKSLKSKVLDDLGEYGKDIIEGFKTGWKTPGVIPKVLKNIVISRTWPLKNLTLEEKKRFAMWFFTGSKILPKELKSTYSKLGFGPMTSMVGSEFLKRYLYLTGFVSFCKLIYILVKNNMSPSYEYDKDGWIKYYDVIIQSIMFPDIKWTSPAWLVTPIMINTIRELFAGGSLNGIYTGLKKHIKESGTELKKLLSKTKEEVTNKTDETVDKVSNTKAGFIFWTKLPKVKKEYSDFIDDIGYTKNPEEMWIWDKALNTFVPY